MIDKFRTHFIEYNYIFDKLETLLEEEMFYLSHPQISILPNGRIFIEGELSNREELREYIKELKNYDSNRI